MPLAESLRPRLTSLVAACILLTGSVGGVSQREIRLLEAADDTTVQATSRCWDFTWVGEQSQNMNGRDDCLDFFPRDLCNPPLIATQGVNAANGPDLDQVLEQCRISENCNETDIYCVRAFDYVCVKYTKFQRGTGAATYYTSFCGKGIDKGWDGVAVTSGCHRETNRDGYDIEVCFCTDELCNSAPPKTSGTFIIACSLLVLLWRILC